MSPLDPATARALQGKRAGLASRLMADAADLITIIALGFVVLFVIAGFRVVFGGHFDLNLGSSFGGGFWTLLTVVYLAYGWATTGQTPGKRLLGLRVLTEGAGDVSAMRGIMRAILCVIFIPGLLWALVSHKSSSLQDLLLDTAVVYDWELPPPAPSRAAREPRPSPPSSG